jgi:predicted alpha/beta hydrolase family esterase
MPGPPREILLLHGVEYHRPPGHWLHRLAEALRAQGERVSYPQLPEPDEPTLEHWLEAIAGELAALDGGERIVVCHSLSCMLWLHHCTRATSDQRVDRVLLVAPPSPSIFWPAVASFLPPALDPAPLAAAARSGTRLVCSDDDPYCPEGAQALFGAPLELDVDLIPGGGHLSEADGYGLWPSMTAWCIDATVRLSGNAP